MEKEVGLGSKKGNSGDIQREDCPTSVPREEGEDDRSDVPEASRWLVVPLHRALFRATATRDRLVDLPLDSYHTRPTFRWSFILPFFSFLPPSSFFNPVALSTRVRFPQRRVFHRFFRPVERILYRWLYQFFYIRVWTIDSQCFERSIDRLKERERERDF